eukprot:CAMPEP_0202821926 /NCGR_PEP_ID=MMETSP1389-20130828/10710_1 /ASSEMBLY_ACC=CAM_ASM_000865 /TAXON_ID=302021 /ORGANISM="Rhodomonas sp., Strain CCMP768" /LENGTH=254 /DNA_ID=CAMNT_0049494773 /DNA_START=379 /DNA_END=1145 /DNA_ORIENTATION=+
MPVDQDKLNKLMASVRTGGKGSVRRKKKAVHKTATTDDKRLQNTLKRLGVNNIPGIEEVNLFRDNGTVIHFKNPKVQASIGANTYVISGSAENKKLQDLLPGIINQLGPDNLENLKKIADQYDKGGVSTEGAEVDDDDDVPELVEDFEQASKQDDACRAKAGPRASFSFQVAPGPSGRLPLLARSDSNESSCAATDRAQRRLESSRRTARVGALALSSVSLEVMADCPCWSEGAEGVTLRKRWADLTGGRMPVA